MRLSPLPLIVALFLFILAGGQTVPAPSAPSPADKKQIKFEKVTGFDGFSQANRELILRIARSPLVLYDKGLEAPVDFVKYGTFTVTGTAFRYETTDRNGLKKALGEGVYPNWATLRTKKEFLTLQGTGLFEIDHWDKIFARYPKLGYYRWILATEPKGLKAYNIAICLEKLGLYTQALKAYQSLFYFFPETVGWTVWHTPYFPGIVARDKILWLLRRHLGGAWSWHGSEAHTAAQFEKDLKKLPFYAKPGVFKKTPPQTWKDYSSSGLTAKKTVGLGRVKLVQYANGHWQFRVDGKPFPVKAVSYLPTKIGRYPDGKYEVNTDFFNDDANKNGKPDALYDSYIDKNGNGKRDADEPRIGDGLLLKQMGANTLRIYHHGQSLTPEWLSRIHKAFGLHYIMGDFAGMYAIGSGATWAQGTDYTNPVHVKNMLDSIRRMVLRYRGQQAILCWMLGNESNYPVANNAAKVPGAFYAFINRAAAMIKALDPLKRPVAYSNGDVGLLISFAKGCPDVDIFAANVYREANGFGQSFFEAVRRHTGKPVLITEYGVCAWSSWHSPQQAEDYQAQYHENHWLDLVYNMAGRPGVGNALGGVVFEFVDEWWKFEGDDKKRVKDRARQAYVHDVRSSFPLTGMDGLSYEEWFGLFSQGRGTDSPYLRVPRKAYWVYKDLWNRRYD